MKLTRKLVNLVVEMKLKVYGDYMQYENGKKVLYLQVLRGLYGMLILVLLFYKLFSDAMKQQGYKFNPYDPCVCNKMVNDNQHTVRFHVDDLMASHMDTEQNREFLAFLNDEFGKHGEVKATFGP